MPYNQMPPPDLIGLLPPYFKAIKDFAALMETEEIELARFEEYLWQVRDNFFIQTCDEATLRYHERLLRIRVSSSDTIDFRRIRILSRYNNQARLTLPTLKKRLNLLIGAGLYVIDIDYGNYHFLLTVNTEEYNIIHECVYMLVFILPAHLTFSVMQNVLRGYSAADFHAGAISEYIEEYYRSED
jgi:hypothetical protein